MELEAVIETEDAMAAGAARNGRGVDTTVMAAALSNRILPTPSADGGEPGILEADVVQTEDAVRLRYTTTMDNGRIVDPGLAGDGNDRRPRVVPRARQGHASRAIRRARRAAPFADR